MNYNPSKAALNENYGGMQAEYDAVDPAQD
jgi:hypothetical protein